ncbi:metal-dependent hydrolase [Streptomyces sp. L7]
MSNKQPLKARKVSFSWEGTPLHWVPGDPFTTHTINVLHLLLPAGERWFVHVYKQVLPLIRDERLREDVIGFIGQEAMHSQAHDEVLPHLRELGLDPTPYTAQVDWFFGEAARRPHPAPGRARKWWLLERVAIIAAIEHYTAFLGNWVLNAEELDRRGADPTMLDPAALARRRGGRAPVRRLRPLHARRRQLPAARPHLGHRVRRADVPVAARGPLLHGERPDPRRHARELQGLLRRRPSRHSARHRRHAQVHTPLSEPCLPPLAGGQHRAGRRLSGLLARGTGRREEGGVVPKPLTVAVLAVPRC